MKNGEEYISHFGPYLKEGVAAQVASYKGQRYARWYPNTEVRYWVDHALVKWHS